MAEATPEIKRERAVTPRNVEVFEVPSSQSPPESPSPTKNDVAALPRSRLGDLSNNVRIAPLSKLAGSLVEAPPHLTEFKSSIPWENEDSEFSHVSTPQPEVSVGPEPAARPLVVAGCSPRHTRCPLPSVIQDSEDESDETDSPLDADGLCSQISPHLHTSLTNLAAADPEDTWQTCPTQSQNASAQLGLDKLETIQRAFSSPLRSPSRIPNSPFTPPLRIRSSQSTCSTPQPRQRQASISDVTTPSHGDCAGQVQTTAIASDTVPLPSQRALTNVTTSSQAEYEPQRRVLPGDPIPISPTLSLDEDNHCHSFLKSMRLILSASRSQLLPASLMDSYLPAPPPSSGIKLEDEDD